MSFSLVLLQSGTQAPSGVALVLQRRLKVLGALGGRRMRTWGHKKQKSSTTQGCLPSNPEAAAIPWFRRWGEPGLEKVPDAQSVVSLGGGRRELLPSGPRVETRVERGCGLFVSPGGHPYFIVEKVGEALRCRRLPLPVVAVCGIDREKREGS